MSTIYQLVSDDKVYIVPELFEPFLISRGELEVAIENIRKERLLYKTQAAYEEMLARYEGALHFLDAHQEKTNEPDPRR